MAIGQFAHQKPAPEHIVDRIGCNADRRSFARTIAAVVTMLWFCAELPALGLEICARCMLDGARPTALVEDNRVVACNEAALVDGVAIGSSLATAHSISPRLVNFCRDVAAEHNRLRFLADAAYRFSASVSIQEPSAILIEVDGSLKLFGGLYGLKRAFIGLLGELGHRAHIGIGHTPLAALALARARENCNLPRFPGRNDVKPVVVEALRRLSLRHTEFDSATVERLSNMGIDTLGQVFRLPTAELGRRFGPKLLDYLDRISGQQPDPRILVTPTERFIAEINFLQTISNKEALSFPMQRLARDLGHWLIGRQLGVTRIGWRFAAFNSTETAMEIEFARPQQNSQTLLSISRLKLDALDLPDEVLTLQLSTIRLASWRDENRSLFGRTEHSGHAPPELIDQFKARLGDDVCAGVRIRDDHRPEFAWSSAAPALDTVARFERSSTQPMRRPLALLHTPKSTQRRRLELLRGPERIDVGWWTTPNVYDPAHRDYFVARHANGSQCWVFVDRNGDWFIHGYFA
jgi:protein ImuB